MSGAILHNLKNGSRDDVSIDTAAVRVTIDRAIARADDISKGRFVARPEKTKCAGCDYKRICPAPSVNVATPSTTVDTSECTSAAV